MNKLADIRSEYNKGFLSREQLNDDPIVQFKHWLEEAVESNCLNPTALTLATVDARQRPSNRIVLLKEVNQRGFVFFTNYLSKKGEDLEASEYACLNFFWGELERQVRISGKVKKVSDQLSDDYFHSRPRESQIGALVSPQSQVVPDDDALQVKYKELDKAYAGKTIPRPAHWGGYVVVPDDIEFWQGRANRMHDRYRYTKVGQAWCIDRLAP